MVLFPSLLFANEGGGMMKGMQGGGSCPMCGAMGGGGLVLGGILLIAVIGALASLSVFLIRRSRTYKNEKRSVGWGQISLICIDAKR